MPPLQVEISETSVSNHDNVDERKVTAILPLHENRISTTRREVSFYPLVNVKHVRSHVDFTDEEWEASWLDFEDIRRMRRNAISDAKRAASSTAVKEAETSNRGLENKTVQGNQIKRQIRLNAYAAVFLEIELQEEENVVDEDAIASVYSFYSEPCADRAQIIGERDEIEAMKIHKENRDEDSVSQNNIDNRTSCISRDDELKR